MAMWRARRCAPRIQTDGGRRRGASGAEGVASAWAVDRAAARLRALPCRAPAVGRCGRLRVQAGSSRAEGFRRSARSLAEAALSGPWVAAEVCLGRHANDALEVSAYFVQERNWN